MIMLLCFPHIVSSSLVLSPLCLCCIVLLLFLCVLFSWSRPFSSSFFVLFHFFTFSFISFIFFHCLFFLSLFKSCLILVFSPRSCVFSHPVFWLFYLVSCLSVFTCFIISFFCLPVSSLFSFLLSFQSRFSFAPCFIQFFSSLLSYLIFSFYSHLFSFSLVLVQTLMHPLFFSSTLFQSCHILVFSPHCLVFFILAHLVSSLCVISFHLLLPRLLFFLFNFNLFSLLHPSSSHFISSGLFPSLNLFFLIFSLFSSCFIFSVFLFLSFLFSFLSVSFHLLHFAS